MSSFATTSTAACLVSADGTCEYMQCSMHALHFHRSCWPLRLSFSCTAAPPGAAAAGYTIASGPPAGSRVFWCMATTAAILIVLSM